MSNILKIREIPQLPKSTGLMHKTADDSRYVHDGAKSISIKFDSSCSVFKVIHINITTRPTERIGSIQTNENDVYVLKGLEGQEIFNTGVPCNDWHWKNLEDAEIAIAVELLNKSEEVVLKQSFLSRKHFIEPPQTQHPKQTTPVDMGEVSDGHTPQIALERMRMYLNNR